VWGNNYDRQTGRISATPGQVIGGVGSRILNFVLPGAGTALNVVGNGLHGSGPLRGVLDRNGNGFGGPQISPVQREPIAVDRGGFQGPSNLGFTRGVMPSY